MKSGCTSPLKIMPFLFTDRDLGQRFVLPASRSGQIAKDIKTNSVHPAGKQGVEDEILIVCIVHCFVNGQQK